MCYHVNSSEQRVREAVQTVSGGFQRAGEVRQHVRMSKVQL